MQVFLIVIVVAALLAFEFAALRWGYDSRDGFRYLNRYNVRRTRR